MLRIIRYSFADLIRSRWLYFYTGFYLVLTGALFLISADLSKVMVSLMNAILFIVPLVALLFGVMVQYYTREFTELLLAQPLPRRSIFLGQYLGIATALAMSFLLGAGIPFILSGIFLSGEIWNFSILLLSGVFLTMSQGYFLRSGNQYRQGLAYIAVVDLLDVIDQEGCAPGIVIHGSAGWLGQDLLQCRCHFPDICAFTVAGFFQIAFATATVIQFPTGEDFSCPIIVPDQFTDRAFVQV